MSGYGTVCESPRHRDGVHKKRLRGYAKLGYAPETVQQTGFRTIYTENYDNDLFKDIAAARRSVIIAGKYFASGKLGTLLRSIDQCRAGGAKVLIIAKKSNAGYAVKMQQMLSAHDITYLIKNKIRAVLLQLTEKLYGIRAENYLKITKKIVFSGSKMRCLRVNSLTL